MGLVSRLRVFVLFCPSGGGMVAGRADGAGVGAWGALCVEGVVGCVFACVVLVVVGVVVVRVGPVRRRKEERTVGASLLV